MRAAWQRWHFAFQNVRGLPEQLIAGREDVYPRWFYGNVYQRGAISDV